MSMLSTYTWRGTTHKTLDGLFHRVLRETPARSFNFDADHMRVYTADRHCVLYRRTFDAAHNSIIEDAPCAVEAAS